MKKECNVVILPTEKGAFTKRLEDNQLVLYRESTDKDFQGFHLYITSDDEIKEGDFYTTDAGVFESHGFDTIRELSNFKKIMATTDSELTNLIIKGEEDYFNGDDGQKLNTNKLIPQIPESFIKEYVKNPVDKVMVRYDINYKDGIDNRVETLKLDNNTIIVQQTAKETYTRNEVEELIYKATLIDNACFYFDEWITKNL